MGEEIASFLNTLHALEEPENGIHPARIRMVAELLKTRANTKDTQIIATTHSPTLLDLIPYESLYICQKKNGRTVIEPLSKWGSGPLWREPDTDNALNT